MTDDEKTLKGNGEAVAKVAFDYIKSEYFRVIRADGVIGAITPSGYIHMSFFSERPAIPRRMVCSITPEGSLGEEIENEKISRDSIVREMDVDVFLNLTTAKSLQLWLGQKITELESRPQVIHPTVETKNGDKK